MRRGWLQLAVCDDHRRLQILQDEILREAPPPRSTRLHEHAVVSRCPFREKQREGLEGAMHSSEGIEKAAELIEN